MCELGDDVQGRCPVNNTTPAEKLILACPKCGEPNGNCCGEHPVPMKKWQAANLAISDAMAKLLNVR